MLPKASGPSGLCPAGMPTQISRADHLALSSSNSHEGKELNFPLALERKGGEKGAAVSEGQRLIWVREQAQGRDGSRRKTEQYPPRATKKSISRQACIAVRAPAPVPRGTHGLGAHQPPERREHECAVQGRQEDGTRGPAAGQPCHAAGAG